MNEIFDVKNNEKNLSARPVKSRRLSLSLHVMPKTVASNLKKWLFLGLIVLLVFVLISLIFYSFFS